ncbi:FHA domain-containing protein [Nakamurella sp.]|uniref:FHA domain-containing protein n=1 Tax=Nakamurella sp. TaxID=1869182 RepID=UPI003784A1D9
MNVSFDDIRAEVLPGAHLVARVPGIVVVIRRDGTAGEATAADLLGLIRQAAVDAAPAPGRDLARRLTEWVVRTRSVPGFGTIAAAEDGIAVFLHGDVGVAELPEPGAVAAPKADRLHLSGRTAAFTVDRLLPWPAGPVVLTAGATADPEEGGTSIGVLGWSGLVEGLVPGDGIVLGAPKTAAGTPAGRHASPLPSVQAPVPPADPEPTQEHPAAHPDREPTAEHPIPVPAVEPVPLVEPEPAPGGPVGVPDGRKFVSTPLGPPAAPPPAPPSDDPVQLRPPRLSEQIFGSHEHATPRPPLPVPNRDDPAKPVKPAPGAAGPAHVLVKGFRCSRNHHNDPRVSFCSVCGIRMDQRTGVLVDGRRPPLGLLVLDIGSTFVLDDNYLLGRNPEVDEAVISSRLRPIRLDDDSGTLSRVHAEIRLEGWDVLLLDRGSANGTYLAAAGQSGWTRLAPQRPVVLTPGTHVRIGRRVFTFESAHARL